MKLTFGVATAADAAPLASLRTAVAERLTRDFGRGHWSHAVTEKSARRAIETSMVLVARYRSRIIATLRLATKKPWAIDPHYFTAVPRPIYLHDMAVEPDLQRHGIGRILCEEAWRAAVRWPAQSIRLDAYDAPAGAGPFYAKCGYQEVGRVVYRGVGLIYFQYPKYPGDEPNTPATSRTATEVVA